MIRFLELSIYFATELKNFGLKNKKLKYRDKWNTLRELEVDFSYPEKTELPQMGLF